MNYEDMVARLPYWNDLNDAEKELTLRGATIRSYHAGTFIHGYQDACLGMVHIIKGSIRVYITSEEGREVTLFHISEGESCIFSASCVIGEIGLDAQMTTEYETEILAVHSGVYQKLMENNLHVRCFSYELATKRFSSVVWVMQQILFSHFDERMARFLLSVYEKTGSKRIQMTQEAIAQEVNSAREVVARMLRQFASDGWIEINRGSIVLKNINALKELIP